MGYQDITLYHLKFEKRDGLEVTAEGLSTGDLLDTMGLASQIPAGAEAKGLADPAMKAAMESLMATLAGALESWNVEDRKGDPVPCTLAGIKSLKLGLVMDIITAWISAQTEPDPTSPPGSSGGGTTADPLEASIPMEAASPGS